jgi:general transcription factor 3C protein 4
VPHEDALIISLFDGSLHVVHNLSSEPSWAPGHGSLTSQDLSIATRTASVPAEFGGLHSNIVNRISGLVPYGHATVLWAHEYVLCL